MERARHVLRIGFVLLVLVAGLLLIRTRLVPPSYGAAGPYRLDNVAEQRAHPVGHTGSASCKGCHEAEWTLWEEGEVHMKVSCENCHGPGGKHFSGDKKLADARVDGSWKQCAMCHRQIEARPKVIPTIALEKHKDVKLEGAACLKCHNPHSTMFEE